MNVKTVYFEITNRCNLNCATCYNRSGINISRSEISATKLEDSIGIFSEYGLRRVLISGGEPVLHSDFDGILNLIDKYPDLSFGIVTNGTVHNQRLIDMLNTRGNFTLQISLDGSSEETNAKTRGSGNFQKTIDFARRINAKDKNPLLKTVISQKNINDVEDFYRLAVSLDFVPEFAFVTRRGNACDDWNYMSLSPKQKLSVIKQIDKLNREHNIDAFLPLCNSGCPYAGGRENLSLCVKTNGDIQPCSLLYDSMYSLGNIFDFNNGYFNERLEFVSELAEKRKTTDYGCGKCILRGNCGGGCMAEAFLNSGDVLEDDGECGFRKMQLVGFDLRNIRI